MSVALTERQLSVIRPALAAVHSAQGRLSELLHMAWPADDVDGTKYAFNFDTLEFVEQEVVDESGPRPVD